VPQQEISAKQQLRMSYFSVELLYLMPFSASQII